jgi:putative photosynthetic complex assembly protein 2
MLAYATPIAVTLFIWWFSTGAILFLDGLPRRTFRWSMAGASLLCALALYGLVVSRADDSVQGVYIAFGSAMMIWGWNEIGFLLGYVTGSRKSPCPAKAKGWARFVFATQSIIHHEVMLAISALVIAALTWNAPNQFALWTFLVLWVMRLSTKFNIFLGVPNTTIDFLPEHLGYLKSYFAHKPMNLLFPISITIATVALMQMVSWHSLSATGTGPFTGLVLMMTLMVLGLIEHWFLVVPLPFGDLWSWGLASRKTGTTELKASTDQRSLSPVFSLPVAGGASAKAAVLGGLSSTSSKSQS